MSSAFAFDTSRLTTKADVVAVQDDPYHVAHRGDGPPVYDLGHGRIGLGLSRRRRNVQLGLDMCKKGDRRGKSVGLGHGRACDGVSRRRGKQYDGAGHNKRLS